MPELTVTIPAGTPQTVRSSCTSLTSHDNRWLLWERLFRRFAAQSWHVALADNVERLALQCAPQHDIGGAGFWHTVGTPAIDMQLLGLLFSQPHLSVVGFGSVPELHSADLALCDASLSVRFLELKPSLMTISWGRVAGKLSGHLASDLQLLSPQTPPLHLSVVGLAAL